MSAQACPGCGFPHHVEGVATFSAEWYRRHQAHHLAAFPALDRVSRDNLAQAVYRAELAERSVAEVAAQPERGQSPWTGLPVVWDGQPHDPTTCACCSVVAALTAPPAPPVRPQLRFPLG